VVELSGVRRVDTGVSPEVDCSSKSLRERRDALVTNEELVYRQRLQVFQQYDSGQHTVASICRKYGYSRTWFYKFKERRERLGDEGLRSKVRQAPQMPNQVAVDVEYRILDYVKAFPTHGPQRMANELATDKHRFTQVGHTGVYGVLKRHNLNTRKKRLAWVQELSGAVMSISQLDRDKQKSKSRHIEASHPGELVGVDTFYVGCLKGVGRIYQQAACDCFSSFGWAKLYLDKTVDSAIDFLENVLLQKTCGVKIRRLVQDNGKEYTTHHIGAKHRFGEACKRNDIEQTLTNVRHPWTNGYAERFNLTLLDEFYQVAFRKKIYRSLEQLQRDLDEFLYQYNFDRTHQGYKLREHGHKTPAEGFLSSKTYSLLPVPKAA
jgi:transposase InsO family protein